MGSSGLTTCPLALARVWHSGVMMDAMRPVTSGRKREVERLVDAIASWAGTRADVRAVALVGSWARGAARMDSDVDVVVLTVDAANYVNVEKWAHDLGAVRVVRTHKWGVLTERRLAMSSGLEVDVGVVSPSWASTAPLDEGTSQVVASGLLPLHDPEGLLRALVDAVLLRC